MLYKGTSLTLDEKGVEDHLGRIGMDDIPLPGSFLSPFRLQQNCTPMLQRLWLRALADAEINVVHHNGIEYFGAGAKFGIKVFTRDISYSGVLGLNRTHPEIMRQSLRFTRQLRLGLGFRMPVFYDLSSLGITCDLVELEEKVFIERNRTHSFARRTDDVIWLWAYSDLLGNEPNLEELAWMYETGLQCFQSLYDPFFDQEDGLYRGQASFVDVHFPTHKAPGYPPEWDVTDCIGLKATCTNALYQIGLKVMAKAAARLGREQDVSLWQTRAEDHRKAMRRGLRMEDGRYAYFKSRAGELEPRRSALGTALLVFAGMLTEEEAALQFEGYPVTDRGVPLQDPLRTTDDRVYYHNAASWPFVDALFLWAKELALGENHTSLNAALAARTCRPDGTFHEVVRLSDGDVRCSANQLWTAAGFINACFRAGWVEDSTS